MSQGGSRDPGKKSRGRLATTKKVKEKPSEAGEAQQKSSKENPIETKKISVNNQYEALVMEEGEIPPLEMVNTEVEEEEVQEIMSMPPLSPRNERSEKAMEGSTTPRGTWADMVKNNRITLQGFSPERSPSQGSQETQEVASQPTTRGRKSQVQLREQEVEREMELGRQRSLRKRSFSRTPKIMEG